jgi:hypothetical protein
MIRLLLYAVLMACCYLTVQQCKTAQYVGVGIPSTTSNLPQQQQQQQQQSAHPVVVPVPVVFGSAFIGGENHHHKKKAVANRTAVSASRRRRPLLQQQQQQQSLARIGKNGMLLNDPWQRLQRNGGSVGGGSVGGSGYAPTGGVLPSSPTFSTHYHESMWSSIDNGTCLVVHDADMDADSSTGSSNGSSNNHPVYEWQVRAPYVILLGTMKGGTQALTSYLWQHPRFA